jgi:hypothetical protein
MVRTTRILVLTLAAAACFSAAACSGSNDSPTGDPTTSAGTAPTTTAGTGNTTAGTGNTTAGTGNGTAGTVAATAGTGSGTAGAASSTAGTSGGGDFMPLCAGLTTAAGPAPTKAGACTADDPQTCYKTCGPQSTGFKSETCSAGAYAEQSGCAFPADLDAACFKLPTTQDTTCPTAPPQASTECTVAPCTLCNGGGGPTGTYLDSKGASKVGYCVCPAPGASGTSKWSCASTDAWPCPGAKGC